MGRLRLQDKLDTYSDEDGPLYIQPYLDAVPLDTRFLYAETSVEGGVITSEFEIRAPSSEHTALADRRARHFAQLKLGTLYSREAQLEIGERRGSIKSIFDNRHSPDDVAKYLRAEATSVSAYQGVNYWRFALLDALVENQAVCEGAFD